MLTCPEALQPGNTVRVIAPCGVFDRDLFAAGLDCMRDAGLEPVFDDGIFAQQRYLAGSDARRLGELTAALEDDTAGAIWVARGGYGAMRLLPGLDPGLIARSGKWLVGFSDVSALHGAWQNAGLMSVHGANVTTLGTWTEEAQAELFEILFHARPPTLNGRGRQGERAVEGAVVGGNLTVLASVAGTPSAPQWPESIVLLEEVGERPYRLDRSLTQLRQSGQLDNAVGFAIGQLTACAEPKGVANDYDALDVVLDTLGDLGLPIVTDLPVGHERSSRALLLGARMRLDPVAGQLAPSEPRCQRGEKDPWLLLTHDLAP